MRKISFLWLSLLFSGIFLINSCQNEEIGIEEPSIWFGNGQGFIYKDTTLNTLDTFEIQVVAENGAADLSVLSYVRGNIANTKIVDNPFVLEVNGFEGKKYTENPITLEGIDKKGFTTKWKLVAPEAVGTNTYQFIIKDTKGKEKRISLIITTK